MYFKQATAVRQQASLGLRQNLCLVSSQGTPFDKLQAWAWTLLRAHLGIGPSQDTCLKQPESLKLPSAWHCLEPSQTLGQVGSLGLGSALGYPWLSKKVVLLDLKISIAPQGRFYEPHFSSKFQARDYKISIATPAKFQAQRSCKFQA